MDILFASAMAFAATNIDDLFINMLLFAQVSTRKATHFIFLGKLLGTILLFLGSCIGAGVLAALAASYTRWLGLVPLMLGLREWFAKGDNDSPETDALSSQLLLSTTLITIANGGDNLGVYIPLFSGYSLLQQFLVFIVFVIMTFLWCWIGARLTELPLLQSFLRRHKRKFVPVVLICIGLYVLIGI